jgi:NitT/TauT family transport system permease protein
MGNDERMKLRSPSWVSFRRGSIGVLVALGAWEAFARSGLFSQALSPPIETIAVSLYQLFADGSMVRNAGATLGRVLLGLLIACLIGIPLGTAMARYRAWERFWLPLVSVLMPIPSLAWVPLFILWFGIGDITMIVVVSYAATFPIVYNVWTGVRSVNRIWLRAATAMGASESALFWKVVLFGALPYIITGIRLSFGRAWIAVIGGELLASPTWGLGRIIFDAKEFLNSSVMLAALLVIGVLGLVFERVVFQEIERRTVARWGMVASGKQ